MLGDKLGSLRDGPWFNGAVQIIKEAKRTPLDQRLYAALTSAKMAAATAYKTPEDAAAALLDETYRTVVTDMKNVRDLPPQIQQIVIPEISARTGYAINIATQHTLSTDMQARIHNHIVEAIKWFMLATTQREVPKPWINSGLGRNLHEFLNGIHTDLDKAGINAVGILRWALETPEALSALGEVED
jgi:hypothetical protein